MNKYFSILPRVIDSRGDSNPLAVLLLKQNGKNIKNKGRQSFTNSYPRLTPPHSVPALGVLIERWILRTSCHGIMSSRVLWFSVRLCIPRLLRSVLPVKGICRCVDALDKKRAIFFKTALIRRAFRLKGQEGCMKPLPTSPNFTELNLFILFLSFLKKSLPHSNQFVKEDFSYAR